MDRSCKRVGSTPWKSFHGSIDPSMGGLPQSCGRAVALARDPPGLNQARLRAGRRALPLPLRGYGIHTMLAESLLLPLVGRADSAEGRARRGSPGMEHLTDEGLKVRQPQGPGPTDRFGLAPAADAGRAGFDREPYARRPPPRSAFGRVGPPPQGGRGIAHRLCENPIARKGRNASPLRGAASVRADHALKPCQGRRFRAPAR